MKYFAHISEDQREQTVLEHSENVAQTAKYFADVFGCGDWGYCTGLMHDIGKYTQAFQERLRGSAKRVDHATASAKELTKAGGLYALAAYCTAGHHAGLPDMGTSADFAADGTLQGRLKKHVENYQDYLQDIEMPLLSMPAITPIGAGGYSVSFFVRMVYSCLVDADFLDTEEFMTGGHSGRQGGRITGELLQKLKLHVEKWMDNEDQSTVNGRRTAILKNCLQRGTDTPGIYSLTVPTGGGKTIASLGFALQHAVTHGKDRIIYVIPYTSIIEQNAEVFRTILGEDNVLEHHSNVQYDDSKEFKSMQLAAENWDKPVVVTTNVQFFESLFANKSSRCRKLHNMANSVIIFDEAQMLPVYYLKPCVRAMAELAENYKSTIVLCTATQPSLGGFFPRAVSIHELCPDVGGQFQFFKRSKVSFAGELPQEVLLRRLEQERQCLCIVNNRKRAQALYRELARESIYHLSTYMYPKHRSRVLKEIREKLNAGERCIVISTSLVEAGVDLDFQTVHRELAGIDSVVQAAGRCNREGKRPLEESNTYVFTFCEKMRVAAELKQPIAIAKIISENKEDITSLEAVDDYFSRLHYIKGEELDKKQVLEQLEGGAQKGAYPFAAVASQFTLIEENTKMVVIGIEQKAQDLIQRLRWQERSRILMRQVSQYSVQVYEKTFEELRAAGYLEELDTEIAVLRNLEKYSETLGLQADVEFGIGEFL